MLTYLLLISLLPLVTGQSLCDKYALKLYGVNNASTQFALIQLLVNVAHFGNLTASNPVVPGLGSGTDDLSPAPLLDASRNSTNRNGVPSAVNFLDALGDQSIRAGNLSRYKNSNQYILFSHLYQHTGKFLNCSGYGTYPHFPAYSGASGMTEVHRFMNLKYKLIQFLITQYGLASIAMGFEKKDTEAFVQGLNNTFSKRCSPKSDPLGIGRSEYQSMCFGEDCPLHETPDCEGYKQFGLYSSASRATFSIFVLFVLFIH